jgi:DNA-binding CsgD family transcriptional regulator
MVTEGPAEVLHGRCTEREALERFLDAVLGGQSRVLVVCGEAGVGKTALVEFAVSSASGLRVLRAVGVESEMELAFAALQQLCAPMLDRLDRLPAPQRDALGVAFGLRAGDPPDRFLVGLAVLSLLSEVAEEQPLVCVVDDAQWLDRASAQALVFVARRLLVESVALLLVTREPSEELTGFQELVVEGLGNGDARALLASAVRVPLDEGVRERIVAETRGNPLALLELPRGLSPAELAGGFGLPDAPELSGRIEHSFRRRLETLSPETQLLLLVAAAEPVGDSVLLWRAAGRLGIGLQAAAETDGLLTIGARVTFRHPLVRSSVYRAASPEDRRAVHRALADVTDPEVDPDRRAWHLAQATAGLDEDVAVELERSAGRAQARGGLAAAAAFLERAAELTPEPSRRARRALAAAQAQVLAGDFEGALRSLVAARAAPLDEFGRAHMDLLRAEVAFAVDRGGDAGHLLLKAAKRLEPLDVTLARNTYLEALAAAQFAGRLASTDDVLAVARAALSAPPAEHARAADFLLDGMATLIAEGYESGAPIVKRALIEFRSAGLTDDEAIRWLWLACRTAIDVWDFDSWDVLSERLVERARDTGALSAVPLGLTVRLGVHLQAGDLVAAAALAEEVEAINLATGSHIAPYGRLLQLAWHGEEQKAMGLIDATVREVTARGEGMGLAIAHYSRTLLLNGLGRYEDAVNAARLVSSHPGDLAFHNWSLAELVEAATRTGDIATASEALEQLTKTTRPSATDWALGIESQCRALLSDGDMAEQLYADAITKLENGGLRLAAARAKLLHGEWLRRNRRNLAARSQLRTAHAMLTAMRVDGFAERARVELEATGERRRKRTVETRDDLTPQEARISRLAADGATNQEIAAQLFISPSTVDYHLRKAFRKLGVKSRHQLELHLLQPGAHAEPAVREN